MLHLDALPLPLRGLLRRRHRRRHAPEHRARLAGRLSAGRSINGGRSCVLVLFELHAPGGPRRGLLRGRGDRRHAPEHRGLGRRRRGLRRRLRRGLRQFQERVQCGSRGALLFVPVPRLRQPGRQLSGAEGRQRQLARRLSSLREPLRVLRSARANLSQGAAA